MDEPQPDKPKPTVRRQYSSSGRLVRGEAMKRELAAAGSPVQNDPGVFKYPSGRKVAAVLDDLLKALNLG